MMHVAGCKTRTELDKYFCKVVGMAAPTEEAATADRPVIIMGHSKSIFLDVGNSLNDHANRVEHHARDITAGTETWLSPSRHAG